MGIGGACHVATAAGINHSALRGNGLASSQGHDAWKKGKS